MDQVATQLNQRRQTLLELIVGDYIKTATPVASQQIVQQHELRISPATIRNDMAELEEMGYISRPHVSAGGIPIDPGYRFYVERTARRARPSRQFEAKVQEAINLESGDPETWAETAASLLAAAVQNAAIVMTLHALHARMLQLQLVQLQERLALLVLVMQEARVRQHLIQLAEPTNQNQLSDLALRLNTALAGRTAEQIKSIFNAHAFDDPSADTVVNEVLVLLGQEEQRAPRRRYVQGLTHLLNQPEFRTGERAHEAIAILEQDEALHQAVNRGQTPGRAEVVIGEEHQQQLLHSYSVVVAQYGVPGDSLGVVTAVGPTRMDYVRAMANVRYLAGYLNDLIGALNAHSSPRPSD